MTKRYQLVSIIILITVCGLAIIVAFGIAAFLVAGEPISKRTVPLASISDDDYTIRFAKSSLVQDGETHFQIYSMLSDGSELQYEETVSTSDWEQQLDESRVIESMGNYYGPMESPNGSRRLKIETGISGWFSYFMTPRIYLEQDSTKTFLWDTAIGELLWLPDSERMVFTSGSTIYIMNTTTGEYAPLVDGLGFIKIKNL